MFNWYFASGDLEFFWADKIQSLSWLPNVFRRDLGFGFDTLLSLWLEYPFRLLIKILSTVGLSWFVIEKLLWLAVFAIAVYSSHKLTKSWIAPIIYAANTYIVLLFTGGQLGVAFAYALAPLVLFTFTQKNVIGNGLWFALLVACDLRIAYLILGAIMLYYVVEKKSNYVFPLFQSLGVAASVHLYWILPTILASRGTASLGEQFTNPGMLKFLSFADFSHALSLLHPNWPENLFGKIYFLQPEFLVIPIVAFAALLFRDKKIRFFALLALIGVFFAKGVNGPFGGVFSWMFTHVPGFVMFRDPTKFYILSAIGYSVLIPFVLKKLNKPVFYILFAFFWICTLRGIHIVTAELPREYRELKNMLSADTVPSRTLWIPQKENFAFYSDTHPIVTATDAAAIDPSVKYVIVPIDVAHRIFLNNYAFDPSIRARLVAQLTAVFPRNTSFSDLAVFENPNFTTMRVAVPADANRQQNLANIGVGISAGFLVLWSLWLFFTRSSL